MSTRFSEFAQRFIGPTGTRLLMDDLGEVLSSDRDLCNLGGGNPAQIPAMQTIFRDLLHQIIDAGSFDQLAGSYDGPQGHLPLLRAIADLLNREYGWGISADNVAMTVGSQSSFFILFNLLSGKCGDGRRRRIQLPLTPEYIGYADIAVEPYAIQATRPAIDFLDDHIFKYRVDFDRFAIDDSTGAVCVSRPTNPTGNVLSEDEMSRLMKLTRDAGVPFIIDNAYGVPFPNIVFSDARPIFDDHVIYCMSLSKLGLPGMRTGIVIAGSEIIEAVRSMNAIFSLATGSLGAGIVTPLVASGEILQLSREVIQPFYRSRVEQAVSWCHDHLEGLDYFIHKPEGAIFLWLWFPRLPITAARLYARLKERNVLVIPGNYFFPGLNESWEHMHECIRISYAQSAEKVEQGIRVIADEVRQAFRSMKKGGF